MHLPRTLLALVFIIFGLYSTAAPTLAAEPQWQTDTALLAKILGNVQAGGIGALQPHAKAAEKALKAAPSLFRKPISVDGKTAVLTDGTAETTVVLVAAAAKKSGDVVAFDNPYPLMGLLLGSFYVETGKYRDALRVIDAALALSPLPGERLGATVPDLYAERGSALGGLKRWDAALDNFDIALGIKQMDKRMRAVLHRGRGFALIELGRLEEAEAAYRKSLDLDPGNKIALGELQYIEAMRAGAQPTAPQIVVPKN